MTIIYGILLGAAYFIVGWIVIEIPLGLLRTYITKRSGGNPDAPPSLRTVERVVIIQVVLLSYIAYLIGIQISIILIAAFMRFLVLAMLKG